MTANPSDSAFLLKVVLPTEILLNVPVTRVVVEAVDGSRGFLPRHIDFVTVLDTGILSYVGEDGAEGFVALDRGVLVKKGYELRISAPGAIHAPSLGELASLIAQQAAELDTHERESRSMMARLETGFLKRFIELVQ